MLVGGIVNPTFTRVRDVASVAWARLEKCYREKLERIASCVLPTFCLSIMPRVSEKRESQVRTVIE
jgi:hypothetical protein